MLNNGGGYYWQTHGLKDRKLLFKIQILESYNVWDN